MGVPVWVWGACPGYPGPGPGLGLGPLGTEPDGPLPDIILPKGDEMDVLGFGLSLVDTSDGSIQVIPRG